MRLIITLIGLAQLAIAQSPTDTIQLIKQSNGVTFTQFALEDCTLKITYPGEVYPVEIGAPIKYTEQLGIIPGYHVWGVDTSFSYRIIMLEDDVAIEVFMPKVGVTLQYGNTSLLYLLPEPVDIVAFKQAIAIKRANLARDKLLKEFSKRFNCSHGYMSPARMPVYDTSCRL